MRPMGGHEGSTVTGVLDPTSVGDAQTLLARVVAMLTKMTR
jgi:hypothetical protein